MISRQSALRYILAFVITLAAFRYLFWHGTTSRSYHDHDDTYTTNSATPAEESAQVLPESAYEFTEPRPLWLTPKSKTSDKPPLVLRLGVITHPSDFERRRAFREYMLRDLPQHEVIVDYRFLMGYAGDSANPETDMLVLEEQHKHGDIYMLDMMESKARVGEKRWRMLKWAAMAHSSTYDYYFSVDSDVFLRLAALARRLPYVRPDLDSPRTQLTLWGYIFPHKMHWIPNPYDNETTTDDVEIFENFIGPAWYDYPVGFGLLMSSALVDKLADPKLMLPHHVRFPADDVLVGSWISEHAPETVIVNDKPGFHDAHNVFEDSYFPVTYDTVCTHHVSVGEMKGLRERPEFADEWVGEW